MSRLLGAAIGSGLAGVAISGGVTRDHVHVALLVAAAACVAIGLPAATELSKARIDIAGRAAAEDPSARR
jgi:hypothetical protein